MQKFGVVNDQTATCTLCGKSATSTLRGESRCDDHAGTDDVRTGPVKTAEEHSGSKSPRTRQQ